MHFVTCNLSSLIKDFTGLEVSITRILYDGTGIIALASVFPYPFLLNAYFREISLELCHVGYQISNLNFSNLDAQ